MVMLSAVAGGIGTGIAVWALLRDTVSYAGIVGVLVGVGAGALLLGFAALIWLVSTLLFELRRDLEPAE